MGGTIKLWYPWFTKNKNWAFKIGAVSRSTTFVHKNMLLHTSFNNTSLGLSSTFALNSNSFPLSKQAVLVKYYSTANFKAISFERRCHFFAMFTSHCFHNSRWSRFAILGGMVKLIYEVSPSWQNQYIIFPFVYYIKRLTFFTNFKSFEIIVRINIFQFFSELIFI